MTILAAFAGRLTRRMDTALQGISAPFAGLESQRPISGPATPAKTPQRSAGVALLIQREILIAEAKHLNQISRCREASFKLAEARRLTTDILRGGHAKAH